MKNIYLISLITLAFLAGAGLMLLLIPHLVEKEVITQYEPIYVEKLVYTPTECPIVDCRVFKTQIELSQERVERLELLEEYKETGFPEIRPANYVPHCDRAGVAC